MFKGDYMWYTVCLRVCFLNTGQVALCWCEALFTALVYVGGSIDQSVKLPLRQLGPVKQLLLSAVRSFCAAGCLLV